MLNHEGSKGVGKYQKSDYGILKLRDSFHTLSSKLFLSVNYFQWQQPLINDIYLWHSWTTSAHHTSLKFLPPSWNIFFCCFAFFDTFINHPEMNQQNKKEKQEINSPFSCCGWREKIIRDGGMIEKRVNTLHTIDTLGKSNFLAWWQILFLQFRLGSSSKKGKRERETETLFYLLILSASLVYPMASKKGSKQASERAKKTWNEIRKRHKS